MTEQDLAAIEARVNAATPGVWKEHRKAVEIEDGRPVFASTVKAGAQDIAYDISRAKVTRLPQDRHIPEKSFDADFIAHSRADIPDLVREVKRLQTENRILRANVSKSVYERLDAQGVFLDGGTNGTL